MKNSKTKRTTVQSVMRCSEFRAGFIDFKKGRPMRDDWEGRDRSQVGAQQWNYERGRLFGAIASGAGMGDTPLKIGRDLNPAMIDLAGQAFADKSIL